MSRRNNLTPVVAFLLGLVCMVYLLSSKFSGKRGISLGKGGRLKFQVHRVDTVETPMERVDSKKEDTFLKKCIPPFHENIREYRLDGDVKEKFECVALPLAPNPKVCLYGTDRDKDISGTLRQGRMWEEPLVKVMKLVLDKDKDLGVIDLGAHIGVYSIFAAALGHQVLAVEPVAENVRRLHKAVQLGGFQDKVTVLHNAMSDDRRSLKLKLDSDHGTHAVSMDPNFKCSGNCEEVPAIVMDDISPCVTFKRALLKVDVERYDHRALKAANLIFFKIQVPYVLMEWYKMKSILENKAEENEEFTILNVVYQMFLIRSYMPYDAAHFGTIPALDFSAPKTWPQDVIWVHKSVRKQWEDQIKSVYKPNENNRTQATTNPYATEGVV